VAYRVVLADTAKDDASQIYDWVAEGSAVNGPEWFEELIEHLHSLENLPHRCPVAREAKEAGREIRCLLFGRRKGAYRILYAVDEAARLVRILHIRHGARRDLTADELSQ
jgi:plasmid stabilization system protein ParE